MSMLIELLELIKIALYFNQHAFAPLLLLCRSDNYRDQLQRVMRQVAIRIIVNRFSVLIRVLCHKSRIYLSPGKLD